MLLKLLKDLFQNKKAFVILKTKSDKSGEPIGFVDTKQEAESYCATHISNDPNEFLHYIEVDRIEEIIPIVETGNQYKIYFEENGTFTCITCYESPVQISHFPTIGVDPDGVYYVVLTTKETDPDKVGQMAKQYFDEHIGEIKHK